MTQTVQDLIEQLEDPRPLQQRWAVEELGRHGSKAASAVPALVDQLAHPEWRRRELTAHSLGRIGSAAVDRLRVALSAEDEQRRVGAAKALAYIGPAASAATPDLMLALGDQNPAVTVAAANALGAIGPEAEEAVEPLIGLLCSKQAPVGVLSRALAGIGGSAIGALRELLDGDDVVAASAATALGKAGSPSDETVQALVNATSAEGALRHAAVEALTRLGGQATSAVSLIGKLLHAIAAEKRVSLYAVLGAIGTTGAVDILVSWAQREEVRRDLVPAALGGIRRSQAIGAVPCLVDLLPDEDVETRFQAVHALGNIGETDGRVADALSSALQDPEPKVADSAIHALGRLQTEKAAAALQPLIQTTSGVRRSRVISALGECGRSASAAVPALLRLIRGSEGKGRATSVLDALAQIGVGAEIAVPDLLDLLFSPEATGWVPIKAASALGSIGPSAVEPLLEAWEQRRSPKTLSLEMVLEQFGEESVPALGEGLRREVHRTRVAVARHLGGFPASADTIGPLLHAVVREDENDRVRDAAAVALGRLRWPTTRTVQEAEHLNLITKIGEGAFGTVWLAEDTRLGRRVAVKVFKAAGTLSLNWLEQGQALARVNHPNVNKVYSVDHIRDPESDAVVPALVLELVEGESLEAALQTEHQPAQLLELGLQVIEGLRALHEAGVYHLDLHEENIMVARDGRVSLIDINYLTSLTGLSSIRRAGRDRLEFGCLYGVLLRLLREAEAPVESREVLVRLQADQVYDLDMVREQFVSAFPV